MEVTINGATYTLTHRVGGNNGKLGVLLTSGNARHILSDTLPIALGAGEFCARVREKPKRRAGLYKQNLLAAACRRVAAAVLD